MRELVAGITGGEAAHALEAAAPPSAPAERPRRPKGKSDIGAVIAQGFASGPAEPPTPAQLAIAAELARLR
ncbi:MAG: hypothetical protein IT385_02720 [Deltaproteobacteria bacterium]|nr:hypothetical protein [Deltaproteobacteria bacterium]